MVWVTLGTSILSALIGAISALLVVSYRHKLQKETKRSKLRKSLYSEISSMDRFGAALDMIDSQSGRYFYTHHDFITTDIYDGNISDLGLLSQREIEKVVQFYTNGKILSEEIKACEKVLNDEDASLEEKSSAVSSTKTSINIANEKRTSALETLSTNINFEEESDANL